MVLSGAGRLTPSESPRPLSRRQDKASVPAQGPPGGHALASGLGWLGEAHALGRAPAPFSYRFPVNLIRTQTHPETV